jgi:hypothetical protein
MKKILIGGCSFSQYSGFPNENVKPIWTSWTDFFLRDYSSTFNITNRAQGSFGQSRIVETITDELIKNNFNIDYVIIQWSAIGRGYSINESSFFERMVIQSEVPFSPHIHEYISNNDKEGWVTNLTNTISKSFYTTSLNQILLMKSLLELKGIRYKMFWGWEQLTPVIENETRSLLNLIYDDSFWRHGNHGGMSEWILSNMNDEEGFVGNGDFHPSTKGHEFFYNTIIKDILNEI